MNQSAAADVFSQAPDELLVYLCHFFPAKDIAGTISRLNQRWHTIAEDVLSSPSMIDLVMYRLLSNDNFVRSALAHFAFAAAPPHPFHKELQNKKKTKKKGDDKKVRKKKKDKKAGSQVDVTTMESILLAHAWLLRQRDEYPRAPVACVACGEQNSPQCVVCQNLSVVELDHWNTQIVTGMKAMGKYLRQEGSHHIPKKPPVMKWKDLEKKGLLKDFDVPLRTRHNVKGKWNLAAWPGINLIWSLAGIKVEDTTADIIELLCSHAKGDSYSFGAVTLHIQPLITITQQFVRNE